MASRGPQVVESYGADVLTWRWIPETGPVFVGDMTWPNSYDAADHHAAALLDVAEEGFVERCAPRPVPSPSAFHARVQARSESERSRRRGDRRPR